MPFEEHADPAGGGDVHMKRSGMLVKPQNETYLDLFAKIK